jgi:hypothetical protein
MAPIRILKFIVLGIAACSASVRAADDASPFSLTDDIERRFESAPIRKATLKPLATGLLGFTQAMPAFRPPYYGGRLEDQRFPSSRWRRIQIETGTGVKLNNPTMVEAMIAGGFPEGRIAAASASVSAPAGRDNLVTPAHAIRPTSEPALNHLAAEARNREPKMRLAVQDVAMRLVDEGSNQFR